MSWPKDKAAPDVSDGRTRGLASFREETVFPIIRRCRRRGSRGEVYTRPDDTDIMRRGLSVGWGWRWKWLLSEKFN